MFRAAPPLGPIVAALLVSLLVRGTAAAPAAPTAEALPAWLALRPNTLAFVDVAPWVTPDEPEAALTETGESAARDYGSDVGRPADVVYQPIGARVRIVRTFPDRHIALVHGLASRWQAYAPIDRLVPDVPRGTRLTAAGGFGGYADVFVRLAGRERALRVVTGTGLSVLGSGVAPYDPANSDLVRLHVRVLSGELRGKTGWVAVAYTGLPLARVAPGAGLIARACSCRPVDFGEQRR